MNTLFTDEEYNTSKSRGLLPFGCLKCGETFHREKRTYQDHLRGNRGAIIACSNSCSRKLRLKHLGWGKTECECAQCHTRFQKLNNQIKNSKNHFCSSSCAATYNNTHKTKGTRRSKLEVYLEKRLTEIYPDLEILYSDKTTIKSELDFYIPSLNLAFELNGIFHYEPIYGKDKLEKIQNNDHRKFQACLEQGIELCIIDSSGQKYFKESTSQKYLNIITNLVNSKIEASKTDYVEVL